MNVITARLQEPSTWYGIGVVLATVAQSLFPQWASVLTALQVGLGGLAAVTPDQGKS